MNEDENDKLHAIQNLGEEDDDDDLFFDPDPVTTPSETKPVISMTSVGTTVPVTTTMKNVVEGRHPLLDPKVLGTIGALSGIIVVLLGMIAFYAVRPRIVKREEIIQFISQSDSKLEGNTAL